MPILESHVTSKHLQMF